MGRECWCVFVQSKPLNSEESTNRKAESVHEEACAEGQSEVNDLNVLFFFTAKRITEEACPVNTYTPLVQEWLLL